MPYICLGKTCSFILKSEAHSSISDDSRPHSIAIGHINDDDLPDIVVANSGSNSIGVFLRSSNGTFSNEITYSTGSGSAPYAVAVGDFNSDQRLDIVVANFGTNNIGIFLGTGNGTFTSQTTFTTESSRPQWIAVGYFNNDTALDIAVVNYGTNNVGVLLGSGNGTFARQITSSTGYDSLPMSLVVNDFNNDNQLDIAVANYGTNNVGILLGHRNGTFATQNTFSTGANSHPISIATGDFNNDTYMDIVVVNYGGDNVGILLGYGNGSFTMPTKYLTGNNSSPRSVVVGDFDNDTRLDIAIANYGTSSVGILFGYGSGTFTDQMTFFSSNGSNPYMITTGDFNNDNRLDIAAINYNDNYVDILLTYRNYSFSSQTTYITTGLSSDPASIAVGDLNNDSRPDIIVANFLTNNVGVFLGYGDGTFSTQTTHSTGSNSGPCSVAVGDLNNDRRLDIVVANYGTGTIGISLGYGDGTFSNLMTYSVGSNSNSLSITISDLNKDSRLDIVVANYWTCNIGILFGYGDGTFSNETIYSTGSDSGPSSVTSGDLNNDGWPDIVVANYLSYTIGIFFAYKNGIFYNQITYFTGNSSYPLSVAVGDLNNDSLLDIVVANYGSNNFGVFFGYGNYAFSSQATFSTGIGSLPRSVAIADFNNDSHLDIIVTNYNTDNVGIFLGYGNGSFASQKVYSTSKHSQPYAVAVGDLTNDGWSDAVVANYGTSNVAVLIGYDGNFISLKTYSTSDPSNPYSVAVADLNTDGHLDMTVVDYGSGNIDVFLGYGDGTFSSQMTYPTGTNSNPYDVAIGDFNNDSRLDMVVAIYGTSNIGVALGYGNGTFFNPITYFTGSYSYPRSVAVGDFNSDSLLDIVVANSGTNNFGVFFGYGNGTFSSQVTFSTGNFSSPYDIAVGDFNNDTQLDVTIVNYNGNNVGIFLNHGNSSFSNQNTYSTGTGSGPCGVTVSDLNYDQRLDIAVAICYNYDIGILLGYGNGTFSTLVTYSTGSNSWPNSIVIGDWNNDDRLDIAVANRDTDNIGVFLGNGDGTFRGQRTYSTGTNSHPISIAFGDFNKDSLLDIVVANSIANTVGVFLDFTYINGVPEGSYSTGSASHPRAVALGDFNNDAQVDIAIANYGSGNVGVLFGYTNGTFSTQTRFITGSLSFPTSIAIGYLDQDSELDIAVANSGTENVGIFYGYGNGSFKSLATYQIGINSIPQSIAIGDFNNDKKFDIAVASSGINNINVLLKYDSGAFGRQITYSTGPDSNPKSVAVGDFNKDGLLDFAVTNGGSSNIGIFLSLGNATFSKQMTYSTGSRSNPWGIVIADLNNDSQLDIVVTNYWSNSIGVFMGFGNGTFSSQTIYSTGSNSAPVSVAIGDFNNDSHLDIVVANPSANNIGIFFGYGDGIFSSQFTYFTGSGSSPNSVAIGDLNDDRQPDIVVANYQSNNVGIFLGLGNGTFSIQTIYSTGNKSSPITVVVADCNNDNRLDIVVANYGASTINVLFGSGDGTFPTETTYSTGTNSGPLWVTVGDFNNDNQLDIAIVNYNSNNIGIFLGCFNGTFFNELTYSTGDNSQPSTLAIGDFNSDDRLDILTTNYGVNDVGLFLGYVSETFLSAPSYSTGLSSQLVYTVVEDFDKDSKLDIAVADNGTNNIIIVFGSGYGTFVREIKYSTGSDTRPCWLDVADFNNDSRLDIVVANSGTDNVGVFLGDVNGTFSSQMRYFTGLLSQPYSVAVIDINNDNRLDIAVANYGSNSVGVFLGYGNGSFSNQIVFGAGFDSRPFGLAVGDINKDNLMDVVATNNEYGNIDTLSKVC
jgi:hypothetical protein